MSRLDQLAAVVGGVVAAAARDAHRQRLVVVDWAEPETTLLERCLLLADVRLPVERASSTGSGHLETLRAHARQRAGHDGLLIDPANKTAAVLWPERLAEPLLPLADLYATQVDELAGGSSIPTEGIELVKRAGGIEAVDAFLMSYLDERRPLDDALGAIADRTAADALRERLEQGWWWRRRVGVVPKIGLRTLGIDLR